MDHTRALNLTKQGRRSLLYGYSLNINLESDLCWKSIMNYLAKVPIFRVSVVFLD